jgi:bifunctional DNA-binding transcriptional regulator/antitoxin component of YhaV-PrlF toxin-antitoxin module
VFYDDLNKAQRRWENMEAIEFRTKIKKNGIIQIPKKYKEKIGNTVKVIIIAEQKEIKADIINELLENPIKLKDFSPFSREDIYENI